METLDAYSLVAIYSAMDIYSFAFVMFAIDLAERSARVPAAVGQASAGQLAGVRGVTATLQKADAEPEAPRYKFVRIAFALVLLGWALHLAGVVLRGVGTVNFYVPVKPLPPALDSYWLIIHVFVASLGTAFFAIGAGLSIVQLLQAGRKASKKSLTLLKTMPDAVKPENLAYLVTVVGFVFWTFTLIAGAIWSERAWGRYWGWDTKEVWTFIIWTIYAGYIHARATRGWRGHAPPGWRSSGSPR